MIRYTHRFPSVTRLLVVLVLAATAGLTFTTDAVGSAVIPRGLARAKTFALDRAWLGQAAETDLTGIATGSLAAQKAADTGVKSLAAELVADSTKHLGALRAVARRAGLPLPAVSSPLQRWQAGVLATLDGASFDRQWVAAQIANHQQAIAATRGVLRDGRSRAVRRLARAVLPTLTRHLAEAQWLDGAPAALSEPPSTCGQPAAGLRGASDHRDPRERPSPHRRRPDHEPTREGR